MTTNKKSPAYLIKKAFEDRKASCYPSKIVNHPKDGTLEFRQGFFYEKSGQDQKWGEQVKEALSLLGAQFEVVEIGRIWDIWPKPSYYFIFVRILGINS